VVRVAAGLAQTPAAVAAVLVDTKLQPGFQ